MLRTRVLYVVFQASPQGALRSRRHLRRLTLVIVGLSS